MLTLLTIFIRHNKSKFCLLRERVRFGVEAPPLGFRASRAVRDEVTAGLLFSLCPKVF